MNNSEISFSENALLYFSQNYRYGTWDGEDCARDNEWSGFGFVLGSGGDPLPIPGDYLTGHQCSHMVDVSNGRAAMRLMEEAAPGKAAEWNGLLAYDYGDSAAREAATRIGDSLAGYPLLDDEDLSERESENAARVLIDSYDVPEDIAADVVSALSDDGQTLCTDCHSWDIDRIMSNLGYRECAECDKWLATTFDEPLHYDCAECYAEDDCECISVMIDGYRHGNHAVTMSDVRETLRGCEHCYPLVYPYGKNVA